MHIAILGDTHSRYQTVEQVLEMLKEQKIEFVLHCGDIEDAETVRLFEGFTTHFVFGNCDSERADLRRAMKAIGASIHESYGDLELEGRKIAWLHGDDHHLLRDVERSGHYDFLFYGHTHHAEQHRTGPTLVVNPGALHRARPKSFAVLDLTSGQLQTIELDAENGTRSKT
jgi:putative phosphoesterase